eukprot:9077066-Pyramimonas_sp.AAC.1
MSWAQCAPAPEGGGWTWEVMSEGVQSADAWLFSERVRGKTFGRSRLAEAPWRPLGERRRSAAGAWWSKRLPQRNTKSARRLGLGKLLLLCTSGVAVAILSHSITQCGCEFYVPTCHRFRLTMYSVGARQEQWLEGAALIE